MDNLHSNLGEHSPPKEREDLLLLLDADALLDADVLLDAASLPELTEDVEHLLEALQQVELDVDDCTLQRVLEYARKA